MTAGAVWRHRCLRTSRADRAVRPEPWRTFVAEGRPSGKRMCRHLADLGRPRTAAEPRPSANVRFREVRRALRTAGMGAEPTTNSGRKRNGSFGAWEMQNDRLQRGHHALAAVAIGNERQKEFVPVGRNIAKRLRLA